MGLRRFSYAMGLRRLVNWQDIVMWKLCIVIARQSSPDVAHCTKTNTTCELEGQHPPCPRSSIFIPPRLWLGKSARAQAELISEVELKWPLNQINTFSISDT